MPRPRSLLALGLLGAALLCCQADQAPAPAPTPPDPEVTARRLLEGPDWYRHAVFYEVFVRSFQDSDGDGIGDFRGLTSRLDYLKGLGVDALWLMPIMASPFKDSGYDVADYLAVNPDYGTMADFDELLAEAKKRQMRVVIDLVLNHTSDQHGWFQESRQSRDNARADWYVWSDTEGRPDVPCKTQQPLFGSTPWQLDQPRNQYYFHRFYAAQPDLNYRNPQVVDATLDVARFWLDRGVDGFRCDVIALLYESQTEGCDMVSETRDYIRKLRAVVDQHPGAVLVAESSDFNDSSAYFGNGQDMFHMAFNFAYGYLWGINDFGLGTSTHLYDVFGSVLAKYPPGAQDALVIGSHDVQRASAVSKGKPWRARRATELQFFLRGTPFIYYGDELGLLAGKDIVVDSRDGQRTPMPWNPGEGHGFTTGTPWIGFAPEADARSVAAQDQDPASTLAFHRALLKLRRGHAVWGAGAMALLPTDNKRLFVFSRRDDLEGYLVAVNLTDEPQSAAVPGASVGAAGERIWGDAEAHDENGAALVNVPAQGSGVWKIR